MKQSKTSIDRMRNTVQVYLDALPKPQLIGTFYPNYSGHLGTHAFSYAPSWLEHPSFSDLDPLLQPWEGEQFAPPSMQMFGAFADATPDRWGRMLIGHWEAVSADLEKRPIRKLDDAAFLLAVEDATRMGALRFSRCEGAFLKESTFPIPSLKDLRSLADMCLSIETQASEQHPEYAPRLARLVSASAALGGARPKVSYLDTSIFVKGVTQPWIAKFPAINDDYDVGAWEFLLNQLARNAGILVPEAKLLRLEGQHSTFCVERFDQVGTSRKMYASAMTWLQRQDGDDDVSYLDVVELITRFVDKEMVRCQLEQLFRRVVFNVLTGNRDDHLRNHGFLRGQSGWELSPAFDMNPNPTRKSHSIRIDDISSEAEVDTVMATAEAYQLNRKEAAAILDDMVSVTSTWREEALRLRISRREIQMMEDAFMSNIP